MDYFLSWGTTNTIESVTSGLAQTTDAMIPYASSSSLWDFLHTIIPVELLSIVNLPLLWTIFVWIVIIIWTLKDSNYRSSSTGFCLFSLLLVTLGTPIIWLPIYLAIRPLWYKHERKYWKIMNENIEETSITEQQEDLLETIADEQHITELRKQANLATKRSNKIIIKTNNSKKTVTKPITKKIPTPKKTVTRTAK